MTLGASEALHQRDDEIRASETTTNDTGVPTPTYILTSNSQSPGPLGTSMWPTLGRMLSGHVRLGLAIAVVSVATAVAEAGILTVTAQIATSLVSGAGAVSAGIGPVHLDTSRWTLLLVALGFAIVRLLLQVPLAYCPAVMASSVQARLRRQAFGHFTTASWAVQSEDREGHFQELLTNQIAFASQGVVQAITMAVAFFTLVVLAASAFALNVFAAAAVLGVAGLLFTVLKPLNRAGQRFARGLSEAQMRYAGAVGEANRMAEETQVFGIGQTQRSRLDLFIKDSQALYMRTQLISRAVPGTYQSMIYLLLVLGLIGLQGAHVSHFSSLGAVVLLLVRAGTYGQQVQGMYQLVRQALPYLERIENATTRYAESATTDGDLALPAVRKLAFARVGYAYRAGRPVLSDISFEVSGGETIGVVGPSGAGKSTMVQMLLRLRAPGTGQYLINDVPAYRYAQADWARRVAYVPQQPRLIHASVAENVRLFRPISDEAVQRACQLARIHDEIMGWDEGYDTIVGPRAEAVSGGQQQRICLARALAAEPEMLVLDEPTSALDPRSEMLIQDSLTTLREKLTLFIIAHRMSTLAICDRVMVIIDGRLDAFDTLASLRASNHYYRLASSLSSDVTPDGPAVGAWDTLDPRETLDEGVAESVGGQLPRLPWGRVSEVAPLGPVEK